MSASAVRNGREPGRRAGLYPRLSFQRKSARAFRRRNQPSLKIRRRSFFELPNCHTAAAAQSPIRRSCHGAETPGNTFTAARARGGGRSSVPGPDRRRAVDPVPHGPDRGARARLQRGPCHRRSDRRPSRQSCKPHARAEPGHRCHARRHGGERCAAGGAEGAAAGLHLRYRGRNPRRREHRRGFRHSFQPRQPRLFQRNPLRSSDRGG